MRPRAAAASLLLAVVIVLALALHLGRSHSRLAAPLAARALQARLHTRIPYRCRHVRNDGTITLANAGYLCEPLGHPELPGYWISTSAHRLVDLQPTG